MEEMRCELSSVHFLSLYSFHYSEFFRKDRTVKLYFQETEDTIGFTNEYVFASS